MKDFPLSQIQTAILAEKVDGWLFYDFHGSDPIARRILQVPEKSFHTRRWCYLIPCKGSPKKLMHKIEPHSLEHLPGETLFYAGWKELNEKLKTLLGGLKVIVMNYSPLNAIPYVSRVDAGTLELVSSMGVKVKTSGDLIQQFEAVWSQEQLESHKEAAKVLRAIVDETFSFVAKNIRDGKVFTEYEVQQTMLNSFETNGLYSDDPPIAAVGPHSGDPHYGPQKEGSSRVKEGDLLLIDLWARKKGDSQSVYADITWTGFVGKAVPSKCEEVFQIVRGGRDAALDLVEMAVKEGRSLKGSDVDDAARKYITDRGYGDYFFHRTGHSIGSAVHGNGANMDNFETKEERRILPRTCFSIEPGVYLKEFGIRSEIDVYVDEHKVSVFGQPIQTTVIPILRS